MVSNISHRHLHHRLFLEFAGVTADTVLLKIALLGSTVAAARMTTSEGLLACVNSHMTTKIKGRSAHLFADRA